MKPMVIFLLGASAPRTEAEIKVGIATTPVAVAFRKQRLDMRFMVGVPILVGTI